MTPPWLSSLLGSLAAGAAGLVLAGTIGVACVSWYQITSRDGASGYFVVFVALAGGVAGAVLGWIAARTAAGSLGPGTGREIAAAVGSVVLAAGAAALICRAVADVPPKLHGDELDLHVEFRFPNTLPADHPPTSDEDWRFSFASVSGKTFRKSRQGTVQTADVRHEDGHWIVPARVELFTSRGGRVVTLSRPDGTGGMSFLLPLPARPDIASETWSDWTPRRQPDGQPWPPDRMSCRFRVQRTGISTPATDESAQDA